MDYQNERAFQKQRGVQSGTGKRSAKSRKPTRGKGGARFWKSPGLGFKVPREAIEGRYIDNKCPFTSDVSIRGRILSGIVKKFRMQRTLVVRRDYVHFLPKYQRYEKRHTNMSAHVSPAFRVFEGDKVIMGECRPLSKTKRFNVLKVISQQGTSGGGKKALGSI